MTTKEIAKYEPDKAESAATLALTSAEALDATLRAMAWPSSAAAVQAAKQVKARRLAFEQEDKEFAQPLRALATRHSKRWKPGINILKDLEKFLKDIALAMEAVEQAQQQAALKAASTHEEVVALSVPIDSGLGKRTTWGYEIVNEAEIPEEYWLRILDRPRLEREAQEHKAALNVCGVRPVPKTTGVLR